MNIIETLTSAHETGTALTDAEIAMLVRRGVIFTVPEFISSEPDGLCKYTDTASSIPDIPGVNWITIEGRTQVDKKAVIRWNARASNQAADNMSYYITNIELAE